MHSIIANKHKTALAYLVILDTSSKEKRKPKLYIRETP